MTLRVQQLQPLGSQKQQQAKPPVAGALVAVNLRHTGRLSAWVVKDQIVELLLLLTVAPNTPHIGRLAAGCSSGISSIINGLPMSGPEALLHLRSYER